MSSDPLQGAGVCVEKNYTDYAPEVCVEPEYFTPVPPVQVPVTIIPPKKTDHKHLGHKPKVQVVTPQDHYSEADQMCLVSVSKPASNPLFGACGTENLNQSFMAIPENYDLILCQLVSKEADPELKQLQEQQGKLVFVFCVAKKKDPEMLQKALAKGQSKQVQHAALKALKDAKVDLKDPAMEAVVVAYIQTTNDPATKDPEGKKLAIAALLQVDIPPKSDEGKAAGDVAVSEGNNKTLESNPSALVLTEEFHGESFGYAATRTMLSITAAQEPEKETFSSEDAGKVSEASGVPQGVAVVPPSPGMASPIHSVTPLAGTSLSATSGSTRVTSGELTLPVAVPNGSETSVAVPQPSQSPVTLVLSPSDPSCSQVLLRFMSGAGPVGQPVQGPLSPTAHSIQTVLQGLRSDPILQVRLAQEIFFLLSARDMMTPVSGLSREGAQSVRGISSVSSSFVGLVVQLSLVAGTSGSDGIKVTLQRADPILSTRNEPVILALGSTSSSEQGTAHYLHGSENAPTAPHRQARMGSAMVFHGGRKTEEDFQEVAFVPVNPALFLKLSKESGWGTLQTTAQTTVRDRGASAVSEQERNLSDHQGGQGDSASDDRDQSGGGQQGSDEPEDFDYAFADEEEELDNESAAV